MNFEVATIIEKDNEKYIILNIIMENKIEYAFANKLNFLDEEPTDDYCIFTIINNEIKMVDNRELLDKLLIKFQQNIKDELNTILNDSNEGE